MPLYGKFGPHEYNVQCITYFPVGKNKWPKKARHRTDFEAADDQKPETCFVPNHN